MDIVQNDSLFVTLDSSAGHVSGTSRNALVEPELGLLQAAFKLGLLRLYETLVCFGNNLLDSFKSVCAVVRSYGFHFHLINLEVFLLFFVFTFVFKALQHLIRILPV